MFNLDISLVITLMKTEGNDISKCQSRKGWNVYTKNEMCLWFQLEKLHFSCGWPRSPSDWTWSLSVYKIMINLFSISDNISRLKKLCLLESFPNCPQFSPLAKKFKLKFFTMQKQIRMGPGGPLCTIFNKEIRTVCAHIAVDFLPNLWAK